MIATGDSGATSASSVEATGKSAEARRRRELSRADCVGAQRGGKDVSKGWTPRREWVLSSSCCRYWFEEPLDVPEYANAEQLMILSFAICCLPNLFCKRLPGGVRSVSTHRLQEIYPLLTPSPPTLERLAQWPLLQHILGPPNTTVELRPFTPLSPCLPYK